MEDINYFSLSAQLGRTKFKLLKGDDTLESINIPKKLRSLYNNYSHRTLVVLDYMDRKLEDSEKVIENDSDFLKRLIVELNRKSGGILLLDNLQKDNFSISGILCKIISVENRKCLEVNIKDVTRIFPLDLDVLIVLLYPIFLIASVRKQQKDNCCGGKKKKR